MSWWHDSDEENWVLSSFALTDCNCPHPPEDHDLNGCGVPECRCEGHYEKL